MTSEERLNIVRELHENVTALIQRIDDTRSRLERFTNVKSESDVKTLQNTQTAPSTTDRLNELQQRVASQLSGLRDDTEGAA